MPYNKSMNTAQIKKLANEAAELSGKTLEDLRDMVRTIRELVAQGEDRREMIISYCGEDGEDHMVALRALMDAVV